MSSNLNSPSMSRSREHTYFMSRIFTHLHSFVYMYRYLDYSSVYCLSTFLPTRRTRIWRQLITMSLGSMNRGQRPLCGLPRTPCKSVCICICIYIHVYMYMYMCICMYINVYVHMYMFILCVLLHVYVHMYSVRLTQNSSYVYMYMYICICICIHVYMYMHTDMFTLFVYSVRRTQNSLYVYVYMYIYTRLYVHVCTCTCLLCACCYGVATISRLLKISGLFCKSCRSAL